jgi:hypothetical protein
MCRGYQYVIQMFVFFRIAWTQYQRTYVFRLTNIEMKCITELNIAIQPRHYG